MAGSQDLLTKWLRWHKKGDNVCESVKCCSDVRGVLLLLNDNIRVTEKSMAWVDRCFSSFSSQLQ